VVTLTVRAVYVRQVCSAWWPSILSWGTNFVITSPNSALLRSGVKVHGREGINVQY